MIADIIAHIRRGNHDPDKIWKHFSKKWGRGNKSLICSLIKSILIEPVLKAEAEAREMAAATGAVKDAKAELDATLKKIETELAQNPGWIKIEEIIGAEQKRLTDLKNDTREI